MPTSTAGASSSDRRSTDRWARLALLATYPEFRTLHAYRLRRAGVLSAGLAAAFAVVYPGERTLHLACSDIGPGPVHPARLRHDRGRPPGRPELLDQPAGDDRVHPPGRPAVDRRRRVRLRRGQGARRRHGRRRRLRRGERRRARGRPGGRDRGRRAGADPPAEGGPGRPARAERPDPHAHPVRLRNIHRGLGPQHPRAGRSTRRARSSRRRAVPRRGRAPYAPASTSGRSTSWSSSASSPLARPVDAVAAMLGRRPRRVARVGARTRCGRPPIPENSLPSVLQSFGPDVVVASSIGRVAWRRIRAELADAGHPERALHPRAERARVTSRSRKAPPDLLLANAHTYAERAARARSSRARWSRRS